MKRAAWLGSWLVLCLCPAARANGRYPIANQLVVSPGDPARLVLRTTFGLVLSEDQGASFRWVCEKAAGFVNNEDPPIEVTADNSILVASSQALSISHDGGCAWQQALAELSVVDADVDQSQPKRAVAIASLYLDGGTRSGLVQTLDNGQTWQPLGSDFAGLPATVALAPSAPQRIYASGTSTEDLTPLISRSDDNGAHWQSYPLTLERVTVPFLAAVDPQHPDVVYVRAPTATGTDVLLVSRDAGAHFSSIFKAKGGLYGFALSPDGSQLAVGGPSDPLSVASSADYQFKAVSTLAPLCLKWSAAGLYACADEAKAGFSLGLSTDSGQTFAARFHKPELKLKACPATLDTGLYCPQAWEGERALLGIDAGSEPGPDAGTPAAAVDAGLGGSLASAGSSGATGGATAASSTSGGASARPAQASQRGCSMAAAGSRSLPRGVAWAWFAACAAICARSAVKRVPRRSRGSPG